MLAKLFPKQRDFFPVFEQLSNYATSVITELSECTKSEKGVEAALNRVRKMEVETDRLARESIGQLHESFVTPFDRSHIFQLFIRTGQIVSLTRLVLQRIQAYHVERVPAESLEIIGKCNEACEVLKQMVPQLAKIKDPSQTLLLCMSVYKIRSETDELGFRVVERLYRDEADMRRFMQIRDVNQDLVSIIKKFEEISFLVEEIILEYA